MNKLRAQSRADLLRELQLGRLNEHTAGLYGFRPKQAGVDARVSSSATTRFDATATAEVGNVGQGRKQKISIPQAYPKLTFLRATEAKTLQPLVKLPLGRPVSEEALATPKKETALPLRQLVRWPRLAGWLRSRLGVTVNGSALDEPRLLRHFTHGEPLRSLPRQRHLSWAADTVVLWDRSKEMRPFQMDIDWLVGQLENGRGWHGLRVIRCDRPPRFSELGTMAYGTSVIALSSMGLYAGSNAPHVQAAWRQLGQTLKWQGHPCHALLPCPRRLWSTPVTQVWSAVEWNYAVRLPKKGGQRPLPACDLNHLVEKLLTHLSPAHRISAPLLRASRLELPDRGDVGVEWAAWHHKQTHPSRVAVEFIEGEFWQNLLVQRTNLEGLDREATGRISKLITRDHQGTMSPLRVLESELRDHLSSPGGEPNPKLESFLEEIRDRLRQFVSDGLKPTSTTRVGALASWVQQMVKGFSPEMLTFASVHELIGQCLALADSLSPPAPDTKLPEGLDEKAYLEETELLPTLRSTPHRLRFDLDCTGSTAQLRLAPEPPVGNSSPLALIDAAPGTLLVDRQHHVLDEEGPTVSVPVELPRPIVLQSSHQRLTFQPTTRPAWASRMWYDRYGLAAEFMVGKVPFVLRWISPGRFTMGSPEDEPGRYDNEGPQHEVTISRGYWLGETPVTQAQWQAVVEEGWKDRELWKDFIRGQLQSDPSGFKGPPELPVEKVNWLECRDFCGLLTALMQAPDIQFHLPSEAQWEYACRAGTDTAIYTGDITIKGENDAPEVHDIAWYGGNSGLELEVSNPQDSKGWPKKQFDHQQAGKHRVKLKLANPWGLYDMLGNVWEWCADEWHKDAYQKRADGVTDPRHDSTDDSAVRVMRGGSWGNRARYCRSAYRRWGHPGNHWGDLGLRLAAGQELGGGAVGRGAPSAEDLTSFQIVMSSVLSSGIRPVYTSFEGTCNYGTSLSTGILIAESRIWGLETWDNPVGAAVYFWTDETPQLGTPPEPENGQSPGCWAAWYVSEARIKRKLIEPPPCVVASQLHLERVLDLESDDNADFVEAIRSRVKALNLPVDESVKLRMEEPAFAGKLMNLLADKGLLNFGELGLPQAYRYQTRIVDTNYSLCALAITDLSILLGKETKLLTKP